jgi:ubiquitin C-terminal hydrolase
MAKVPGIASFVCHALGTQSLKSRRTVHHTTAKVAVLAWRPCQQVAAAGLRNLTGDYNCFLNVIIQCLWHCDPLRNRLVQAKVRLGRCMLCISHS